MNIVEKVARALCWAEGWNPDLTLGGDGKTFLWHEYVRPARAAIKSMRIPTPEMMKAGCDAWKKSPLAVVTQYSAMIDVALIEANAWLKADAEEVFEPIQILRKDKDNDE